MHLIHPADERVRPTPLADRVASLRRLSGRRWFRVAALAGLVVALEVLVLEGWIRGARVPPWDFLGAYAQEAYWWWAHGGFFDPVSWIPAVRGGYPASLSLQNSAWYLPYGAVAAVVPLTPWALAFLSAVHVAFGSVGAYLLVRRHGVSFLAGLVAAAGWFFAVGAFSNAEHPDIARGYAWLPWVLLVASTRWPWRRWWSIPVATLVLWQAASGVYPGMLVAYACIGVVWVVLQQLQSRARLTDLLLPLGIAMVAALLLSMVRLLPYVLGNDLTGVREPDASEWSWSMLLSLQFGYDYGFYPNDISMRSFFIPAAVLLAALFARPGSPLTRLGLGILIPAALLGLPLFPWFDALQQLPGLSLSRFTMSDFKVFMLFGVLLLAASAVDGFVRHRTPLPWQRARVAVAVAVVVLLVVGGLLARIDLRDYALTLAVLVASAALVLAVSSGRRDLAALLIVGVVASGGLWAYSNREPWRTDRVDAEVGRFDGPVAELVADAEPLARDRRPGRTPLPADAGLDDIQSSEWNVAYYTGEAALGGYLNLKGNTYFETLRAAISEGDRAEQLLAFLSHPGTAITAAAFDEGCADEACGGVRVTPVAYEPERLEYDLQTTTAGAVVLNEPFYRGWQASVCQDDACATGAPTATDGLVTIDVPEGASLVTLTYATPGLGVGWLLFWAGALIAALAPASLWFSRRRHADADGRGENDA